ncbi:PRC-barrel protein [Clostridia bacterium]|nr:PRC-barrel protein [Clostridia bacterium]
MERIEDLRKKEIIDVCDGKRLGFVCDCEIDVCSGKLVAIIVPRGNGFGFWRQEDIVIPWHNIKKIGDDIIIVDTRVRFEE